jgi:pyruvate-ferredoxin/flavodoxin oxidoreductase
MGRPAITVDGNEAAAKMAFLTNEVIAIYPITPASPMGEFADAWSAAGQPNIWGTPPQVIEMQSEGGAAGAVHGSLQAGALTTTFTASQGLLLMIPNMFKIAGELTPTVFHIAARSVATHALSIFGDHSDVMAARSTGWGMLASASVQEAHDMALIAQMATLKSRIPFLHFFDGFRTSHEVNKIETLSVEDVRALVDDKLVREHRERALDPERPVLRGTAQNPDVFFQAREACNPFYDATPAIVQEAMDAFGARIGRSYKLFDYYGDLQAERVLVLMGSGVGAAQEAVEELCRRGEKVGLLAVRLYRPFDSKSFVGALPATTRGITVLDRTKEPGATGEPLYQDVLTAAAELWPETHGDKPLPKVIGGRYGLSSKEFTPAMAAASLAELSSDAPKKHFTVGIVDDVTGTSIKWDPDFHTDTNTTVRALFYGLGSDGTVSAVKNTVKIIGENTDLHAQGYFVYDSKKSGSTTVSHLRIGPQVINSSYLIQSASFVACHQFNFLERMDMLANAEKGATFLLNSPHGAAEVWQHLPREVQQHIVDKQLKFYVIDAYKVAQTAELGGRINTVMQTCFFGLSGMLPEKEAIAQIKAAINKTYNKLGEAVLRRNHAAVDHALEAIERVEVPSTADSALHMMSFAPEHAPDFFKRVTSIILAGKGDLLPVSALPPDGTFPVGTSEYEKRSIAREIPVWDEKICIQCGRCAIVCPHAAIRMKVFDQSSVSDAPEDFVTMTWKGKEFPAGSQMRIQVAADDCTGCGVCVDSCPARSKEVAKHKAINMEDKEPHLERERRNFELFLGIDEVDRTKLNPGTVKESQLLEPLFQYSGACAGCGETPYLKLVTQLFGDRMIVANATGCSSIYGGNLPTTPWSANKDGRGPAWSNSLFEDNAEFGLGMRMAVDQQRQLASELLRSLRPQLEGKVESQLITQLIEHEDRTESGIAEQRERVTQLKQALRSIETPEAMRLLSIADGLVDRSVWIIGGDGWAYDIGFGGLDHVLASGRNVNILVLDTEVYSNTGGQASKATPRAAVAKFAASGKPIGKKDLGMIAMAYGNVYVAQVALGAQPKQTVRALMDAEAYPGPSLVIAYSTCIAHGIDMTTSMSHQKDAVQSGYWPLYRFLPQLSGDKEQVPFQLDSRKPSMSFRDFAMSEARFAMLARTKPETAQRLMSLAQQDIAERWRFYEQMAGVQRGVPQHTEEG